MFRLENKTKEFAEKVNILQQVPVLHEVDKATDKVLFKLGESHAILRYLARTYSCPEHWYPAVDLKKRAKIDTYLDEHHTFLRASCSELFKKLIFP